MPEPVWRAALRTFVEVFKAIYNEPPGC